MLKKSFAIMILTIGAFSTAHAEMRFPGEVVTDVECNNTSHLPSGLSLVITSGDLSGKFLAELTNRDDIGPYVNLGSIVVTRKQGSVTGAPITYTGKDFNLEITIDSGDDNGNFPAHVYADVKGRVFNEPMTCSFPVHTL
jgi:hypothetical protein